MFDRKIQMLSKAYFSTLGFSWPYRTPLLNRSFGLFILLSSLLYSSHSLAGSALRANVSSSEVSVGEVFVLQISASTSDGKDISTPVFPKVQGAQVVSQGQSSSQSWSASTDRGTEKKTTINYTYQIQAMSQGALKIPPISVSIGGKVLKTQAVAVKVLPAGQRKSRAQNQRSRRRDIFDDDDPFKSMEESFNKMLERSFGGGGGLGGIFGPANRRQPQQPKTKNNISGVEGKPFFILAEVDKTEAFKGEPVVASWYLYTQGAISNIDTLKYPTLKGFWKEDIQIASILNFKETELINGQPYKKALLTSYALFPIEPGKAVVDRYRAKATVRLGFGFGQSKALTEESEPIPIFVKALPKTDQPKNFTGAVGRFQMSVDVVDKTVVQNQPFALKLRFDGQGNAKMIDLPELNLPKGVEIYDQSNESQYFKNGQSYKEFTLLLVPRESGELVLPMIQSSYFNPEEGSYSPLQSEEIKVKVLPGTKSLGIAEERLDSSSVPEKNKLPELRGQAMATARSSKSLPLWTGPILFIFVFLVGFFKFIFDTGIFAKEPDLRDIIKKRFTTR